MPKFAAATRHHANTPSQHHGSANMPAFVFAALTALLMLVASMAPAWAEDAAPQSEGAVEGEFEPTLTTTNNYLPARDAKALPPAPYVPANASGPAPAAAAPAGPDAVQTAAPQPAPSASSAAKMAAHGPGPAATAPGAAPATASSSESQPIRGVVRPSAQANISTDLAVRVSKVGFKAGQSFRAGEVLLSFDCSRQKAEMTSAEALHREMKASYRSAQILYEHKAGSRLDLETSKARVDRAAADLDGLRQRLAQCTIIAPYDGSVVDLTIHEFEMPAPGKSLLSIVSRKDPEIELVVPSSWLTWLTPGTTFDFFVEETGKTYPAKVQRLGATADTVSQTLKVFATFTTQTPAILPGSSGTAKFNHDQG